MISHYIEQAMMRVVVLKHQRRQEGVVIILQSAWRMKQARTVVAALKRQHQRLRDEGAARMLQSMLQARTIAAELRQQQQQRQREKGAVIMLQCAWRMKWARLSVLQLRQRNLDEVSG